MPIVTSEILDRALRNEADAAWSHYSATCRAWPGGAPQRASAYARARLLEDKLQAARETARREAKREKAKAATGQ